MYTIINECNDCGLPCIGELCPMHSAVTYYCDNCGKKLDKDNHCSTDDNDLCTECAVYELSAEYLDEPCRYTDDIEDDALRQRIEHELWQCMR